MGQQPLNTLNQTRQKMNRHRSISLKTALNLLLLLAPATNLHLQAQAPAAEYAALHDKSAMNAECIKTAGVRAQAGIEEASQKAGDADQRVHDASEKAKMAQENAQQANTRIQTLEAAVSNLDQYRAASQIEIRFKAAQNVLSKNAKDALDAMAGAVKGGRGYFIEVQGFSSGEGGMAISNSRRMAESVLRYLVLTYSIPVYRISVMCVGNTASESGKSDHNDIGGGRLIVSLMKNHL
jgi:outer membrane protein OmpA-like peptidoglycan-associated protein